MNKGNYMRSQAPLQHIGIVMPLHSRYDVLHSFAEELYAALCRHTELTVTLLKPKSDHDALIFKELHQSKQLQAIVLFNSYFNDGAEKLFCDVLGLPTLFCLVDAIYHFADFPTYYGILAFVDRQHRRFAEERGYLRTLDLPHAVGSHHYATATAERRYACAMFSSPINYHSYSQAWQIQLAPPHRLALEEAAEELLADGNADLPQTLGKALERHLQQPFADRMGELPIYIFCQQLDLYVKGKGRVAMLHGLSNIQIDLFGDSEAWKVLLGDSCPHVTVHEALSYKDALKYMQETKVVLNNCESIRDGAHERTFAALANGAAVATTTTPFLRETFADDDGILFYRQRDFEHLSTLIRKAIDDDDWRIAAVTRGQERIANHHLWEHRARVIVDALNRWVPLLPSRDPPA